MRAAVYSHYGPPEVVTVAEVPDPLVGNNDVLVKVRASTISAADRRIRAASFPRGMGVMARLVFGLRRPRKAVLGTELTGTVIEVGRGVRRFSVGMEVIAQTGARLGAHAEFVALPEHTAMVEKPAGLEVQMAAASSFGGTTALYFLRDRGGIQAGHRVLVIGAAGVVGSATVQLAHYFGATVDAVCSGVHSDRVRALGAQHIFDKTVALDRLETRYDLILDTVGATSFRTARPALTERGRLLMVAADLPAMLGSTLNPVRSQKALSGVVPERADDLTLLADLAVRGHYRPVIDSVFALSDIALAHRRAETPGRFGSVVVTL